MSETATITRKVVINACFGGFGLSPAGKRAYLARKGETAFFYVEDRDSAERPGERDYMRVSDEEAVEAFMYTTVKRDRGGRLSHDEFWPKGQGNAWYWNEDDVERDDPDLVAVVEELGGEASGRFASLVVVEIPADASWEIAEYDGNEHVAETHRTWYA